MANLNSLSLLVSPPKEPEAVPVDEDWKTLEEGQRLSYSYKNFVALYGVGTFSECVHLCSPSARTVLNIHNVTESFRGTILTNMEAGADVPELVHSGHFFPMDKLGLFVVAESIDGHEMLYEHTSDSERENVILFDSQAEMG